jgi:hypothetical protein
MRPPPLPDYPPVPEGLDEIVEVFGRFTFVENSHALVTPDETWVAQSIKTIARLPVLNQPLDCHIKIEIPLMNAMTEILAAKLGKEIRSCEGCYWPRHKMHDTTRELSVHSWGIAVDLNASTNMPGTKGDMHRRIVEILARHGFYWGGNFGDPMHFQYAHGY